MNEEITKISEHFHILHILLFLLIYYAFHFTSIFMVHIGLGYVMRHVRRLCVVEMAATLFSRSPLVQQQFVTG